jgi:hypothetical protein
MMLADPQDFGHEGWRAMRGESVFCSRKDIDHVVTRVEDKGLEGGKGERLGWACKTNIVAV